MPSHYRRLESKIDYFHCAILLEILEICPIGYAFSRPIVASFLPDVEILSI